jgi:hypothetical protein
MRARAALAGVVLLGAALRLFPIWFGLPYPRARPDEGAALGIAAGIVAGDPNPHFFNWPSLTFYVFAGLFAAAGMVKPALAHADYVLIGRAASALAGTATILVLARLARRMADGTTALLAALFLAVAVLHVRDSHFATTDVLMTLFTVGSLALLLDAIAGGSVRAFAIAGIAGGLAVSTKYSAAALVAGLVGLAGHRWRGWTRPILFVCGIGAGFLAGTPYALADYRTFIADVRFESAHLATGHTVNLGRGWIYHATHSLPYGLGPTLFVAALAGIPALWRHYRGAALTLFGFSAAFFVAIGSGYTVFFRYVLPLIPVACLSAAVAVRHGGAWLGPRFGFSASTGVAVLATAVALPSLASAVRLDLLLARTDSRVLAAAWLAPRLRPESTLHDAGGDYTKLDLARTPFHEWRFDADRNSFGHPDGLTPDWIVVYDSPLAGYTTVPGALRTLVSERYTLAYEVRAMRGRGRSAVFDQQDAFFAPIAGFGDVERPGPNVSVYRLTTAPPR